MRALSLKSDLANIYIYRHTNTKANVDKESSICYLDIGINYIRRKSCLTDLLKVKKKTENI